MKEMYAKILETILKLWYRRERLEQFIGIETPEIIIFNGERLVKKAEAELEGLYKEWVESIKLDREVTNVYKEKCYRCKYFWEQFLKEQENDSADFGIICKYVNKDNRYEIMPCEGKNFEEDLRGNFWDFFKDKKGA